MEHKLQEAFHTLTEAELALFLTEDAAQLPSDPALTARVRQRTLEKAGLTPARKEPAMKKNNTRKHWKTLLVAAALVVLVAFSAFAVVKFALPKAMVDDLSLDGATLSTVRGRRTTAVPTRSSVSAAKTANRSGMSVTAKATTPTTSALRC